MSSVDRVALGSAMRRRAVAGGVVLALFLGLRAIIAITTDEVRPARVVASSTFGDDARYAAQRVVDHSAVESWALNNFWLLPNGARGWLRLELDGDYLLERVSLLNTQNGLARDRRTTSYRVALVGPAGDVSLAGTLPGYPRWQHHDLAGTVVRTVIVYVDGFAKLGGGLNEIALVGRPAHGLGRHRETLLALLVTSLLVLVWWRVRAGRWPFLTGPRLWLLGLSAGLVVFGLHILRFSTSLSTFEWCGEFRLEELDTLAKVKDFFANLRIPIPPALALLEIGVARLTGDNDLVIRGLYKLSIIGAYLLALVLAYPRVGRMVATALVAGVLIAGTVFVHPGNPQIYDTVYPFLIVSFLVLLARAVRGRPGTRTRLALLATAGLTLSLVGLTRPFAIVLVPAVVLLVLRDLRGAPRRELAAFALGALLLAVPWHVYLFARHGQTSMSNHTGFNLLRAWPMVPLPPLIPEDHRPPNRPYNNPQHNTNSLRVQRNVLGYIVHHPGTALVNVYERFDATMSAKTVIAAVRYRSDEPVLRVYQLLVRALFGAMLVLAALRLWLWIRARRRRGGDHPLVARPVDPVGASLLILGVGSLSLLALGDAGEEARFVIALLPMLASLWVAVPARDQRPPVVS
jgi:hypothetical protein